MATTEADAADERVDERPTESESESESPEKDLGRPSRRLRWRVTLGDALLGAVCLAVGLTAGATAMGRLWWLAIGTGAVVVAGIWAVERGATARLDPSARLVLLGGFLVGVGVLAAVALVERWSDEAAAVALLGLGVGLLLYRFVFGVLLPIPRGRFRRIGERRA